VITDAVPTKLFTIGSYSAPSAEVSGRFPFTGSIDDVQVYDHALSPADVTTLYSNPGVAIGGGATATPGTLIYGK
jgi:hypothetical protein